MANVPHMVVVPVTTLVKGCRLVGLQRESRAMCGYLVTDAVTGSVVLCTQRLPIASHYINTLTDQRVSIASLYESAKLSRLVHRRWRVERCALDDVPGTFEARRGAYPDAKAVVLCRSHRVNVSRDTPPPLAAT